MAVLRSRDCQSLSSALQTFTSTLIHHDSHRTSLNRRGKSATPARRTRSRRAATVAATKATEALLAEARTAAKGEHEAHDDGAVDIASGIHSSSASMLHLRCLAEWYARSESVRHTTRSQRQQEQPSEGDRTESPGTDGGGGDRRSSSKDNTMLPLWKRQPPRHLPVLVLIEDCECIPDQVLNDLLSVSTSYRVCCTTLLCTLACVDSSHHTSSPLSWCVMPNGARRSGSHACRWCSWCLVVPHRRPSTHVFLAPSAPSCPSCLFACKYVGGYF